MTVGELIARLQKFPPEKQVGICDADTMWLGTNIHIDDEKDTVELRIEYGEMSSRYGEPR